MSGYNINKGNSLTDVKDLIFFPVLPRGQHPKSSKWFVLMLTSFVITVILQSVLINTELSFVLNIIESTVSF